MKKEIEKHKCHAELVSASDPSAQGARCRNKFGMTRGIGFTLAEVLITLGIIGVVAALTMPSLTASYRKKVVETRLQKFYSVMQQAVTLSEVDNGDRSVWLATYSAAPDKKEWYEQYLGPYIKSTKVTAGTNGRDVYIDFIDGTTVMIGMGVVSFYPNGTNITVKKGVNVFNFDNNFQPYSFAWDGDPAQFKTGKSHGGICYAT